MAKSLLENVLGNTLTRSFLSVISKKSGKLSHLERSLLSYNGGKLFLRDIFCKGAIEIVRKIVGLNKKDLTEIAGNIFLRKGALLYAQSIAKFGITNPQIYTTPHHIIWNLTNQCNLGTCEYCYQNSSPNKTNNELNLEKKLELVEQFADMNVGYIIFSGGEPLTSKDFFKTAEYTTKKGIGAGIATNGILLDEKNAKKLKEIGIKTVNITLNGARAETHDGIARKKGVWEKSIMAIKNSKKYGLRVETNSVITPRNFSELEDIIKFSKDLKVDCIKLLPIIPAGRGAEIEGLNNQQIEQIVRKGYEHFSKGTYILVGDAKYAVELTKGQGLIPCLAGISGGCYSGRMYCAIQPNGIVTPCPVLPIEAGDVKKESFYNIWNKSEVFNKLRNRNNLKGPCGKCKDKDYCGGCRARAYGKTGDYLGSDPTCNLAFKNL